jgi:hypothetical protein
VQIDIGPVIAGDEQIPFNIMSENRMEAKVHLQGGDTRIEAPESSTELFQVSFVAPRSALVQIDEARQK